MQINQRLYLLSQLKSQGMYVQALHTLFMGLIMSRIAYALPGQLSADDRNMIGAIITKGSASRSHTHTLLSILRKSSTVPIGNFLSVLRTIRVTVYIIFFLPKPLHTALIVSAKDNILTNSLTQWRRQDLRTGRACIRA